MDRKFMGDYSWLRYQDGFMVKAMESGQKADSQGENVNGPASVIVPLCLVWCMKETVTINQ